MNDETPPYQPATPLGGPISGAADNPQALTSTTEDEAYAYTPGRIFTVALAGAFSSLLLYYAYQQLESDSKQKIKSGFLSLVKGQVRSFVGPDE